jgi:Leucine-rich repeat (LRR) protein
MSTIKKPALAPAHNIQATPKLRPLNTKTASARTPKPEPSPTGSFGQALSPPGTTAAPAPFRQIPTKKTADAVRKISTPTTAVRNPPAKTRPAPKPEATASAATTPSKPSSSSALRDQIAKAREAAKRNKAAPVRVTTPPRDAIIPDPAELAEFDFGLDDPFNQASKGGKSLLRKRVDGARADGRLNIAGMDLTEIPDDVLNMYQYDPSDASVAWGEVVDLTVIVAADNALDHLPEAMFPDVDVEDYVDSDEPGPQFGAVQSLDFHGNVLRELPIGLRRLTQLSKLNLSRNKLSMDVFEILAQMPSLRELKLAENDLQGDLVADLQGLSQLEVLDLSNNKLTSLPTEVRELAHLRTLNVAENQLRSVPMELFTSTSLIHLNATKNRLEGSFFMVDVIPNLQELRLSNNALTSLSDSTTLELPALTYLDLSANRLSSLPDMTSWTNLTTLRIGENKLTALPDGFLSLQKLRIADFTANDLTKLDERIALMEALENLSLAANPLRERKFLTMSTDDIRRDLASRLPSEVVDDDVDGEVLDDQVSGPSGGWTVTPAGTLDLSNKDLTEVDEEALLALDETKDIRQLNLQQNQLFAIPPALAQLSHLTTLDLSKNNITTLSHPIELPRLRDLRLAGNKLTSLAPLIENLTAPTLQSLDISQNRLTGALPALTTSFPSLILLLAPDNNLSSVPAPSLTGLRTVNIANNSIARLDPRIGLLAGSLTSLVADGNTFRVPNYQTLQKGTEAVLAWLRERVPAAAATGAAANDDDDYEDENEQMGRRVQQQEGWQSARSSSGTAGEFFDADEGGF